MKRKDREELRSSMTNSAELLQRAKRVLLSHYAVSSWGNTSDVVFVNHCEGSRVLDVDNNEYVDMCLGYGPIILGHSHPNVTEAVKDALGKGAVHGFGHAYEIEFAELLVEAVPFAELATFTNSGTEATMHAIKIARSYTGKDKIAKFEGCYHGTHDYVQISGRGMASGPIEAPESRPLSAGIPEATVEQVITLSLNQPESFEIIRKKKREIAAVIVEPVPTCCPVNFSEFLRQLRRVTEECGIVLIFDEVLSGFRLNYGSVAGVYGVTPDLSTFGKIIGGGLPAGAIVGNRDFLKPMISTGDIKKDIKRNVFIVGTFSGNPLVCAAGGTTLRYLRDHPDIYAELNKKAARIKKEITAYAREINLPFQALGQGSWFLPYFSSNKVEKPRDVDWAGNGYNYEVFKAYMCKNGVLLADVPLLFLSAAHTEEDCDFVINAVKKSFDSMY